LSDRVEYSEFLVARKHMMDFRAPIARRSLGMWMADFQSAFEGIPYLRVGRAQISSSPDSLIEMAGSLRLPSGEMEYVRRDIEKVYNENLGGGTKGSHSFSTSSEVVCFHFCCVTKDNEFVTGRLKASVLR
jgi:hypothetical protein